MNYPDGLTRTEWLAAIKSARNPFYVHPENPNQKIWRYMDFAKFVALIESSELFFPVASGLDDPLEGSVSEANLRERSIQLEKTVRELTQHVPTDRLSETRSALEQHSNVRAELLKWQRQWTYVSCWHSNDHESAAMWKLYGSNNQAIAIQSTFEHLSECLEPYRMPPNGDPILSKVHYVDYLEEPVRRDVYLSEFFHKRKSFAHEEEIRAVVQGLPTIPRAWDAAGNVTTSIFDVDKASLPGKSLKVNLDALIDCVYIAPQAPGWLEDLVKRLLQRFAIQKPVVKSALNAKPLY